MKKIKEPLEKRVAQLTKALNDPLKYRWLYIAAGLAIAFLLMLTNSFIHKEELPLTISSGFFGIVAMIVGGNIGYAYRRCSDHLHKRFVAVTLLPLMFCGIFIGLGMFGISALLSFDLLVLFSSGIYCTFYCAKTRDSVEGVKLSRQLTVARNYFRRELVNPDPAIRDEWFPYLLAFGLGPFVDAWANDYRYQRHFAGSCHGGGSGLGFSGGGGRFGGGSASGAWAAAATSLGASSSSSSSSGGGGGSSGGGGGGGW